MKKLIRLIVACTVRHDDKYYQIGLKSMGIDYTDLTHDEICAYKASQRVIEADMLIDVAYHQEKTIIDDVDLSKLKLKLKL